VRTRRRRRLVGGIQRDKGSQPPPRAAPPAPGAKHQLNLNPAPEGTQKNLDARRYGDREEQRIPRVGGSAGAAQGVPGYLFALGDRTGRTVAKERECARNTDPSET
jgi:hypothetical protein